MKPNSDIRYLIKKSPLKSYEVAKALGYSSGSALSTKLQTELTEEDKKYFIQKIQELSNSKYTNSNFNKQNIIDRYVVQDKLDRNTIYVNDILKKTNQLRLEIDRASTKKDFEHISKLAKSISELM